MVLNRLSKRFAELRAADRAGLVVYTMAGDPDHDAALAIMKGLPGAGVDIIELGMPFSDPMADGPAIQLAAQRSLAAGGSLARTLDTLRAFRKDDRETPVVLMGYYNPIHAQGPAVFAAQASAAGADGVIVVDLPPEEAPELTVHLNEHGIHLIFLTAPTTDAARLPTVLEQAGGFLYYVSITGVTGTASADEKAVEAAVKRLRQHTDLPIAVGFGINTPAQAAAIARVSDAAVVGSAVVKLIAEGNGPGPVLDFVRALAEGVHSARK
ncbi:MAG: tryptophan synthase subunit alpha [Rhodospirillaceae bacterium BRH_c57]|nr:MAG: tryptophan synthase subunit alpha [Rhodospirillaceae bacterium BRH_c57]